MKVPPQQKMDKEMTDEELASRMQSGEETALSQIMHRHKGLLFLIIDRILNNLGDTQEILNEVWMEVWNRIDRYDEKKGKFLGWLVTLARRRAIDRLRKRESYEKGVEKMRMETKQKDDLFSGKYPGSVSFPDVMELLNQILDTLPESQKEAIELTVLKQMSQRQASIHSNIPLGTIKNRIELGIHKMRSAILDHPAFQEMYWQGGLKAIFTN